MKKFVYGLIAGIVIIPLTESLMDVAYSWIEVLKLLPAELVLKGNEKLTELKARQEPISTDCIGFQYKPVDDEDDYNE